MSPSGQERETVEFTPNVPVEVALQYPTGKIINTRNGDRVMFSLVDGRVMFLDLAPAEKINQLAPKKGEPIVVCKHWSGKRGEPVEWNAWLAPVAEKRRAQDDCVDQHDKGNYARLEKSIEKGETLKAGAQRDGTFVVPGNTAQPSAPGTGKGKPAQPPQPWAHFLLAQSSALIDAYAAALSYAKARHGQLVSAEDVRTLVVTAYIQQTRNGGPHVA